MIDNVLCLSLLSFRWVASFSEASCTGGTSRKPPFFQEHCREYGSRFPGELSLAEPGEPLGEKLGGDPEVGLLEPVERLLKEEIQHNVTSCGAYSRPQPRLVVRLLPCRVAHQPRVQSQIRAACTTSEQGSS